jgi:thioredoxin 1
VAGFDPHSIHPRVLKSSAFYLNPYQFPALGQTLVDKRPMRDYICTNFVQQSTKGYDIMADSVAEVSDSGFEAEVLQSDKPVLVDFWAPWCGPCKAIGPVVEDLAASFGDKVKFLKCNVDDNPVTPGKFGIKAIPTLIFFKGGDVVDQITGMVAKSRLEESINKVI